MTPSLLQRPPKSRASQYFLGEKGKKKKEQELCSSCCALCFSLKQLFLLTSYSMQGVLSQSKGRKGNIRLCSAQLSIACDFLGLCDSYLLRLSKLRRDCSIFSSGCLPLPASFQREKPPEMNRKGAVQCISHTKGKTAREMKRWEGPRSLTNDSNCWPSSF